MITFDALFSRQAGRGRARGRLTRLSICDADSACRECGVGGGVSSAIARALGAGRRDRADALVYHTFVLELALAALFSTTMLLSVLTSRWMGGQGEMLRPLSPIRTCVHRRHIDLHAELARRACGDG